MTQKEMWDSLTPEQRQARLAHLGKGPEHPNWKGGRTILHGYIRIWQPDHPRATKAGYVREHILVAEKALGKLLPPRAQVHHWNGNRQDNANANLLICQDQAYHSLIERRTRALDACGDANAILCVTCKRYDRQDQIAVIGNGYSGYGRHRDCHASAERERKRKAQ